MIYQAGSYDQLCSNQIHLWLTYFDDPRLDGLLDDYRALLTVDELAQEKKFHFDIDRRRYLITRALLRCTLSRYVDMAPSDWRFSSNKFGRPHIDPTFGRAADIRFNVSHTNCLVVIAVSVRRELGVDTENVMRRDNLAHLADRFFSSIEAAALSSLSPLQQHTRFFEYWTLKEAYIKARGMGLSIPLSQFSFDLSSPSGISLHIEPQLGDDAERWAFWQWSLGNGYLLALCAERDPGSLPCVQLWRTWPKGAMESCHLHPVRTTMF